jgi:hypothetical protein
MTEAELQAAVIELAHLRKWRTMHQRPGLTQSGHWRTAVEGTGKGWPDLVLCRDRLVIAELKSAKGLLSVDQQDWLHALKLAGVECHVWKPADWTSGEIEKVLA